MTTIESGLILDMSDAEYHSRSELSSTGLRLLLPEYKGSPQKFQWAQSHRRESRAFDVGHAAHAKVLGVGSGVVYYPEEHLTPSGKVSTKLATQTWEAEMRAAGLAPVSPEEGDRVDAMAEAVLEHPSARPYLEAATLREVSAIADLDGVPVRARLDAISEGAGDVIAVDLKTTEDATPHGFTNSVRKYGYDVQEAHYEDVYEAATGRPVDEFLFIAVEKSGPFEVAVHKLPTLWASMGRRKAQEARRIYAECVETGVWPGYDTAVQYLEPPAWTVTEYEMTYDMGMHL